MFIDPHIVPAHLQRIFLGIFSPNVPMERIRYPEFFSTHKTFLNGTEVGCISKRVSPQVNNYSVFTNNSRGDRRLGYGINTEGL